MSEENKNKEIEIKYVRYKDLKNNKLKLETGKEYQVKVIKTNFNFSF